MYLPEMRGLQANRIAPQASSRLREVADRSGQGISREAAAQREQTLLCEVHLLL